MKVKITKQHTYGEQTFYPAGTYTPEGEVAPAWVEVSDVVANHLINEVGCAEAKPDETSGRSTASRRGSTAATNTEGSE